MRYQINQRSLSKEERAKEFVEGSLADKYHMLGHKPSAELVKEVFDVLYKTNGYITADSPDDVFFKGNIWEGFDDDVEHIGKGMYSISIGDVLIEEDGKTAHVVSDGFITFQLDQ